MKKLVLFDIDGTLLKGVGIHTYAMKKALKDVFNHKTEVLIEDVSGKTDRQIMTETLLQAGFSRKEIDSKVDDVIENMVKTFKNSKLDIRCLPGVPQLLELLSKRDDIVLGLLTGNPEQIATIKLEGCNLKHYFVFGAFGHEHIDRAELVKDAIKRAHERFDFEKVIIIGDTHRDIIAAHKNKAIAVAVATGYTAIEKLKAHAPEHLLKDLSDTNAVINIIAKI